MKEIKNSKKGFTLLELLVVVLIIGILAAVALPKYQLTVDKARYSSLIITTKALADANERFYLQNNRYSTNFYELDIDISPKSITGNGQTANFDWGICRLISQQDVSCTNFKTLKNGCIIKYNYSSYDTYKHNITCSAPRENDNDRYNRLCKNLGIFQRYSSCSEIGDCNLYLIRK